MSPGIVVYVPAAPDHPATSEIARGSAILGRPEPGGDDVRIYFEGAVHGQTEMQTFADRAVYACGRLVQRYPTIAARLVPRDALIAVGTFEQSIGEVVLTGPHSAALVAEWLDSPGLDPVELRRGGHQTN